MVENIGHYGKCVKINPTYDFAAALTKSKNGLTIELKYAIVN
jgi:hypothetical protein